MTKNKTLSLAILATAFSGLHAAQVQSYEELTSAVRQGKRLTIVLDLEQCTGRAGMPVGYFTPNSMLLMPASETALERVVTSELHFTDYMGKPMYEYVKYTINSDGTVVLRTTHYGFQDDQPIGPSQTLQCVLGEGVEIFTDDI